MNITSINLLIRFNKTPEIFRSVSQVLSILLTPASNSAILGIANSKERVGQWLATCVRKAKVQGSSPAVNYAQGWAKWTLRGESKCPWSE